MKIRTCFSDTEHRNSFLGRWIWIYTGSGSLEIEGDSLVLCSGSIQMRIMRESITKIDRGSFSRTAKPIRLDYINIEFNDRSGARSIHIVPLYKNRPSWFISVWRTNRTVLREIEVLQKWQIPDNL